MQGWKVEIKEDLSGWGGQVQADDTAGGVEGEISRRKGQYKCTND